MATALRLAMKSVIIRLPDDIMIEYLANIDQQWFLTLNGINSAFFDELFWLITGKFAWIPMICVLLYCSFRHNWKVGVSMIVAVALVITLCDQISSGIIKDAVCRLRPTHDPDIGGLVHVVNDYRGGQYGFVSSHAANSFGVAVFLAMVFRRRLFTWVILAWALILSYSRIYLGVHYPGDIVCGGLLGAALGALVYCMYKKVIKSKSVTNGKPVFTAKGDAELLSYTTIGNLLLIILIAIIIFMMK